MERYTLFAIFYGFIFVHFSRCTAPAAGLRAVWTMKKRKNAHFTTPNMLHTMNNFTIYRYTYRSIMCQIYWNQLQFCQVTWVYLAIGFKFFSLSNALRFHARHCRNRAICESEGDTFVSFLLYVGRLSMLSQKSGIDQMHFLHVKQKKKRVNLLFMLDT